MLSSSGMVACVSGVRRTCLPWDSRCCHLCVSGSVAHLGSLVTPPGPLDPCEEDGFGCSVGLTCGYHLGPQPLQDVSPPLVKQTGTLTLPGKRGQAWKERGPFSSLCKWSMTSVAPPKTQTDPFSSWLQGSGRWREPSRRRCGCCSRRWPSFWGTSLMKGSGAPPRWDPATSAHSSCGEVQHRKPWDLRSHPPVAQPSPTVPVLEAYNLGAPWWHSGFRTQW